VREWPRFCLVSRYMAVKGNSTTAFCDFTVRRISANLYELTRNTKD
jgi:hypothetical protein